MSDFRFSIRHLPPWTWVVGIALLAGAVGWWIQPEEVGVPKPLGQIRITLPDTGSTPYFSPCASAFRVPNHAKIELQRTQQHELGCW